MEHIKDKWLTVAVVLVLIGAMIFAAFFIFSNQNESENSEEWGTPIVDRSIHFPVDEGKHDEPSEAWQLFMKVKTPEGNLYFQISWGDSTTDPVNGTMDFAVTDKGNFTGKEFLERYEISRHFSYSEGYMNLKFSKYSTFMNMESVDNKSEYMLSGFISDDNVSYNMSLSLNSLKDPVAFTQARGDSLEFGTLYVENGTLYGYVLPRLNVSGSMSINGKEYEVTGRGFLMHYWGAVYTTIFEFLCGSTNNYDFFSITYYSSGGSSIVLEQLYVIHNDGYSIYSTFKGYSIGAYVRNSTYRNLTGETYSLYPTSYTIDPTDPYHHRSVARNWTISSSYDGLNITITPVIKYQFLENYMWSGAVYVKENDHISGFGFAVLNKKYRSSPYISKVWADKQEYDGKYALNIKCEVTDPIPLKSVTVYYTMDNETYHADMEWNERNRTWETQIGLFDPGTKISYHVVVIDLADSKVTSDEYIETL